MPWSPSDATRHTKAADTPHKADVWSKVANDVIGRTGDDATAVREADAVVNRMTRNGGQVR